MSARNLGPIDLSMRKTEDGFRDYIVKWKIETTSDKDGPAVVEACPGLPLPGSTWRIGNDINDNVSCTPEMSINRMPGQDDEPGRYWIVEQTFSDRRTEGERLSNPLLEAPRWSGGFLNKTKAAHDLLAVTVRLDQNGVETPVFRTIEPENDPGVLIYPGPFNTAWEPYSGKIIEFETGGPTVEVEINLLNLPLVDLVTRYKTVNGTIMWGLPPRTIKLTNCSWQRKTWNSAVTFFYIVKFEFEIDFKTWDRYAENVGTMCLKGHSPGSSSAPLPPITDHTLGLVTGDSTNLSPEGFARPYYLNPKNFEVYKDSAGENATEYRLLNEYGVPVTDVIWEQGFKPVYQKLMYYRNVNYLDLGIPPVIPTGTF